MTNKKCVEKSILIVTENDNELPRLPDVLLLSHLNEIE